MNIVNSAVVVGAFTAMSRLLGMAREILLSYIVGASQVSDALVIAFKVPNFFRRFFGEGAFNAALVPQLTSLHAKGNVSAIKQLIENLLSFLTWSTLILVVLILIFTKGFLLLIMPGLKQTPDRLELAITFTRITSPYVFFISLVALMSSVLNALNRFVATAMVPLLLNVILIMALVYVDMRSCDPGPVLSIAVFMAGALQFGWLYTLCYLKDIRIVFKKPQLTEDVKRILKLIIPNVFGAGVMQINLMICVALASFLPIGSMTYLYYADRFNQLPISVCGGVIGMVFLTTLSRYWGRENKKEAIALQIDFIEAMSHIVFPCTVFLFVFSYPLTHLVYGHGKFTELDTITTAMTLGIFALSLPAYAIGKIFVTIFFARQESKIPVQLGCVSVFINFCLGFFLMKPYAHVGLALSLTLTTWIVMVLLGIILHKKELLLRGQKEDVIRLIRIFVASCLTGMTLFMIKSVLTYPSTHIIYEFFYNIAGLFLGITVHFAFCYFLKVNFISSIRNIRSYC